MSIITTRENIEGAPALPTLGLLGFFGLVIYGALFGMPHKSSGTPTIWLLFLRYGWLALAFFLLVAPLWKGEAQKHWVNFKKIRFWVVVQNLIALFLVGLTGIYLSHTFPFLNGSWLHIVPVNGDDGGAPNLITVPLTLRFVGPVFFVLLILNIPMLANSEEKMFRVGTRSWPHALWRSLLFGLCHCTMGVSVATGLALSIGGLWFSWNYFRGGEERCTLHHTTYNLICFSILALMLLTVLR